MGCSIFPNFLAFLAFAGSRAGCSTRPVGITNIPAVIRRTPRWKNWRISAWRSSARVRPRCRAVPFLGKYAKQLYVLQRTASTVDQRVNPPTDPEWAKTLKQGWQLERQRNFQHHALEFPAPGDFDLICDIWTEINRNLTVEFRKGGLSASAEEYMAKREVMDYRVMERLRLRVESIVEDKQAADILKPWYRYLCKRPASNNEYYPTFNRPNVKVIDVSKTQGVEALTEHGFIAAGVEYPIDCLIFASGFEVTSDLDRRWGIEVFEGRGGKSIYEAWAAEYRTLHGMMTHGFPNQFFTGFIQGGFAASTTETFNQQGKHIAFIIAEALKRGAAVVEPTLEAQDAYVDLIRATTFDNSAFIRECTPAISTMKAWKWRMKRARKRCASIRARPMGRAVRFSRLAGDMARQRRSGRTRAARLRYCSINPGGNRGWLN